MWDYDDMTFEQLSLSELLSAPLGIDGGISKRYSVDEIAKAIKILQGAKHLAGKREKAERRQREQEEQRRKEQEEQKQREEHIRSVTSMDLPLDWNNAFDSDPRTQGIHTDSISDALVLSLTSLGKVDIEYISSITGEEYKTVIGALKGSIYQNPDTWRECFYKGWETSEEYLSGNLMRKLRRARAADETYHGYFRDNVNAIEKILPPSVATKDIYITLGSPWVPADVIDSFIVYLFGCSESSSPTVHDELTGTWHIPEKGRYRHSLKVRQTYGTEDMEALYILEKTLNMKPVTVTYETYCPNPAANIYRKKRAVDKPGTVLVLEKQRQLIEKFQKWVWKDEERKNRLLEIFESRFGCVRHRIFDGSFLTFPTLSPDVRLYPYQKDAVARILFSPNTLLAHDVGSGKTYVMIAAGQELRRMGLSKKNLYVVPNNIVGQWENIFLTMYPDADILIVEPKSFEKKKREDVLLQIRDEDHDAVIMAYSCFEQIPLSKEYYMDELTEKKQIVAEAVNRSGRSHTKYNRAPGSGSI